jgi:hypothetical protein
MFGTGHKIRPPLAGLAAPAPGPAANQALRVRTKGSPPGRLHCLDHVSAHGHAQVTDLYWFCLGCLGDSSDMYA